MSVSDTKKVALVTGGSRGIGAAVVAAFLSASYAVVSVARSIEPRCDGDLLVVRGDITDPESARQILDAARRHFGRVDCLVNNAGVYIGKPFADYTLDDFAAITAVNLAGFFHMTQQVLPLMVAQGGGHVVNVTTSLVDQPDHKRPAALAALTKGGLAAVTRSLAIEYAPHQVRFNAVSLGIIKTWSDDPETDDQLAALHPLGRTGDVRDVADGILYLERAAFVTGEILHIDGGQSAGH